MSNEIKLTDIINMMLRRWWIIALCAVVSGIAAFIITYFVIDPLYISKGLLYVNNTSTREASTIELNDLTTSQKLVNTYIEILKSDSFMQRVAENSGLGYSADSVRKMVAMSGRNQTEILEVKTTSKAPEIAFAITSTILQSSNEEIGRVIKGGSVEIVDNANFPTQPSFPNHKMNILIGVILGVAIGALIIFAIEMFDIRVKNHEDLQSRYEFPILGLIPNLKTTK